MSFGQEGQQADIAFNQQCLKNIRRKRLNEQLVTRQTSQVAPVEQSTIFEEPNLENFTFRNQAPPDDEDTQDVLSHDASDNSPGKSISSSKKARKSSKPTKSPTKRSFNINSSVQIVKRSG